MIEAEEMQHAMHHEMGRVICGRDASIGGLGEHGFAGEHHIAEGQGLSRNHADSFARGKRQHVGGRVLAAPGEVQGAHLMIVGEHEGRFASRAARRRGRGEGGTSRADESRVAH